MKQREYPLFIIDTSRQHKRERDTDYLQCTAVDCPFIAEICFINEDEFRAVYKREDKLSIYSHSNCGIRIRIHIVQFLTTTNEQRTTSLLKKALKCVLERRKIKDNPKYLIVFLKKSKKTIQIKKSLLIIEALLSYFLTYSGSVKASISVKTL